MELELRRDWDLYLMIGLTLLLIPIIYIFPDSVLRTVIGLPFLLFFPGYLAIAALFPRADDLDSIERVALSFGLSIAITPLIGFGLNYTPWGIRLDPILFSISGFILIVALVALQRRGAVLEPYLPFDPFVTVESVWRDFQKEQGLDKALSVILALSILSSVVALAYVIAFPREGESFTEFYILGPDGKASGYPNEMIVGKNATIIIGLANHEHRTVNYTIVIWLVNMSFEDKETQIHDLHFFDKIGPIELEHVPVDIEGPWKKQWEMNYTFSIDYDLLDEDHRWHGKIWFSLYKGDHDREYTKLQDYSDDDESVQSILDGVKNKRLSLNLNLKVSGTEFYVLDEDMQPLTSPLNLMENQNLTVTLGISNHMLRNVSYSIVIWMVNSSIHANGTNITELYHIDTIGPYELEHVTPAEDQNYTGQWEMTYNLSVNTTFGGDPWKGTAVFDLYIDDTPGPYTKLGDYADDEDSVERVTEILEGLRQGIARAMVLNEFTGTEFYVLDEDMQPLTSPLNLTENQNLTVTLGISNHMHRNVSYSIVIWMVNSSTDANGTNITELYHIDDIGPIELEHISFDSSQNYTGQWEMTYNLSVNTTFGGDPWNGTAVFDLYIDDTPGPYTKLGDYADDEDSVERVTDILEGIRPGITRAMILNAEV